MKSQLSQVSINRFKEFKRHMHRELGQHFTLSYSGEVIAERNEFSPRYVFRSLQEAIDYYARYLPHGI